MVDFFYGVIEGFYGRQWSWQTRMDYALFLKQFGFDCYLYAPKGDAFLRSNWRSPHPADEWQQLQRLSTHYHSHGLRWGLGLSPLGLSQHYTATDKQQLKEKVERLAELSPDILCILFDDVRGDIDGLAERQLQIIDDILAVSTAKQHIVCPTYYSFDPVLEQVFGPMPVNYWSDLGAGLPAEVGVFWTGNQVISTQYSEPDLAEISSKFNRRPILWDNYPVNDGRVTSQYLHLAPYTGRPTQLSQWSGGHIVNPMNQPLLSQFVLQSLAAVYDSSNSYNADQLLKQSLDWIENIPLSSRLAENLYCFQYEGITSMSVAERELLAKQYYNFNHPLAEEVADWLSGGYQFDPACLTG